MNNDFERVALPSAHLPYKVPRLLNDTDRRPVLRMTKNNLDARSQIQDGVQTPEACYRMDLQRPDFQYDPGQEHAVKLLQCLYDELLSAKPKEKSEVFLPMPKAKGLFAKIKRTKPVSVAQSTPSVVKGLYLWGGVGRGKTYLMDTFYKCLPGERKLRIHFHRFMRRVHKELKFLQGKPDPLKIIGRQFASDVDVICFDEFFVTDITDAMLLGGVLNALFAEGVVLVATSNIPPQDLYKDGLQRDRFLPAIALLIKNQVIYNLDGGVDYRLRALERAEIYHFPLDDEAALSLQQSFQEIAGGAGVLGETIEIESREIATLRHAEGVLWCDFAALCDGPRSQNDYIELAHVFSTVLVSNVPQFDGRQDDQARRFINMVDEFYDRNVKLILSAAVAVEDLYIDGRLRFEFRRTQSRLLEMQSREYLERAHLP